MSLRVETDPVQQFSGGFTLSGTPNKGEMQLTTPLGTLVGELAWSLGGAQWFDGKARQDFAGLDALLEAKLGTSLPIKAFFAWMDGQQAPIGEAASWVADISEHAKGRVRVERASTSDSKHPPVQLRIAIEPQ